MNDATHCYGLDLNCVALRQLSVNRCSVRRLYNVRLFLPIPEA